MTELSPFACILDAEYHCEEHQRSGKMYSAGVPVNCVEIHVVDAEDREVPRGTVREIIARKQAELLLSTDCFWPMTVRREGLKTTQSGSQAGW
jgi:acyl-CoA synthetase (AMP-forming)/AMP-acid ligase II